MDDQPPSKTKQEPGLVGWIDKKYASAEAKKMREVIDTYDGIFQFSKDKWALWCIACEEELESYESQNVKDHVDCEKHKRAFEAYFAKLAEVRGCKESFGTDLREEAFPLVDITVVGAALMDSTFVYVTTGLMNCNVCQVAIKDSVTELWKHLQNKKHKQFNAKKLFNCDISVVEFVNKSNGEFFFEGDQIRCKTCQRLISAKYLNVKRHLATKKHKRAHESDDCAVVDDEENNHENGS